jgi:hypothetical protein
MGADSERAEDLRRSLAHFDAQKAAALDDNGRKDASRQACKAVGEIRRVTGAKPGERL